MRLFIAILCGLWLASAVLGGSADYTCQMFRASMERHGEKIVDQSVSLVSVDVQTSTNVEEVMSFPISWFDVEATYLNASRVLIMGGANLPNKNPPEVDMFFNVYDTTTHALITSQLVASKVGPDNNFNDYPVVDSEGNAYIVMQEVVHPCYQVFMYNLATNTTVLFNTTDRNCNGPRNEQMMMPVGGGPTLSILMAPNAEEFNSTIITFGNAAQGYKIINKVEVPDIMWTVDHQLVLYDAWVIGPDTMQLLVSYHDATNISYVTFTQYNVSLTESKAPVVAGSRHILVGEYGYGYSSNDGSQWWIGLLGCDTCNDTQIVRLSNDGVSHDLWGPFDWRSDTYFEELGGNLWCTPASSTKRTALQLDE